MIEAVLIAIVAVGYAQLVSILSMAMSVLLGSVMGLVTLAHVLVVVVFIGGGFGLMGWTKQRMSNPLVNVGSTLASLAIISVVTKENAVVSNVFSNQKIVQVFKMLVMGVTCTAAVNLLVWRVSARSLLRSSMKKASSSLGGMLTTITSTYLNGSENDMTSAGSAASLSVYTATYPQMMKNLRETKFEHYFLGREKVYVLERSAVKALETLAQSVGGLRSAAQTQLALLQREDSDTPSRALSPSASVGSPVSGHPKGSIGDYFFPSGSPPRQTESRDRGGASQPGMMRKQSFGPPAIRTGADVHDLFVTLMSPPTESLTRVLSQILQEPPFGGAPDYEVTESEDFRQQLTDALSWFNVARKDALQELYSLIEMGKSKYRSGRAQADFEEVAAACGHFSFSLQIFGEEMQKYLDVLDDLKYVSDHSKRSWRWLLWWRNSTVSTYGRGMSTLPFETPESETLIKPIKKSALPKGIPDSMIERRDTYNWQAAPDASKMLAVISKYILRFLRKIAQDDSKYIWIQRAGNIVDNANKFNQFCSALKLASALPCGPCLLSLTKRETFTTITEANGVCYPS